MRTARPGYYEERLNRDLDRRDDEMKVSAEIRRHRGGHRVA